MRGRERGSDKFFGNSAKSDEHLKQDRSCAHVSERVRERESEREGGRERS